MTCLSHGLLSFYEEKLWGIYYVSCRFFALIPLLFYASGHSHLVQQMSPDVLLLQCVTEVLGIHIFCVCFAVFNARHRDVEFLETFHCRFPLHSSILDEDCSFPLLTQGTCEKEMEQVFECLYNFKKGDQLFPLLFFSF